MENNFDKVAWCYDGLSYLVFGNALKRSQIRLLDQVSSGNKVLIIGGGTGWILKKMWKEKKNLEVDYIEASAKMLSKASGAVMTDSENYISFRYGNELSITKKNHYDVVMAGYFFDLFTEDRLKTMIPVLVDSMKEGGKMLVTDFHLQDASPWWQKKLLKMMYSFFRKTCRVEAKQLGPFRAILENTFLSLKSSIPSYKGFLLSEVYVKKQSN